MQVTVHFSMLSFCTTTTLILTITTTITIIKYKASINKLTNITITPFSSIKNKVYLIKTYYYIML